MLWRDLKAWQIYGANTDVGKTVLSTILCKALARHVPKQGLLYLKPVSTGPDEEADDRHIARHVPTSLTKCIKQYSKPVSPHLAAKLDSPNTQSPMRVGTLSQQLDMPLLSKIKKTLSAHEKRGGRYALLETAGGVLSPAPSGTVQADLYRPLRLPVLLVGDSKLGGIGATISAFESLHVRGYDVESVLLFNDPKWGNYEYLKDYLVQHNVQTYALPVPPTRLDDTKRDQESIANYYEECSESPTITGLVDTLRERHFARVSKLTSMPAHAESVVWHPFRQYGLPQNVVAIDSAYQDYFETYDQETDAMYNIPEGHSTGLTPLKSASASSSLLTPLFDASASWWTQGLGHGNPNLALTAAHAAGRYGHVMFGNAVHEPAIDLSYQLLSTLRNPRLSRVFFTDNGSTGMEAAVKMALRSSCARYGWNDGQSQKGGDPHPIGILGLKGSYHGDTIGVMNCSEPSAFNEKVDWYQPWGHWFSPPEVKMCQGEWQVKLPDDMHHESRITVFPSLSAIFDFDARQDDTSFYEDFITRSLKHLTRNQNRQIGALILEPLIMGAGGMIFVDPLFQRTLIKTVRSNESLIAPGYTPAEQNDNNNSTSQAGTDWKGLPVIADEVFTGLYRLGRASSASFLSLNRQSTGGGDGGDGGSSQANTLDLDISPDISVHAKLLTGGLLPLSITTASESVFNAFLSDKKADALLHGHSYTAHPVGCSVAVKSLEILNGLASSSSSLASASDANTHLPRPPSTKDASPGWASYRRQWSQSELVATPNSAPTTTATTDIFSFWSPESLVAFSHHSKIASCFAIGTVLALTVKTSSGASGYSSMATSALQRRLLTTLDDSGRGIHSRVLGDVIYFMTSLETPPDEVKKIEGLIMRALDHEDW